VANERRKEARHSRLLPIAVVDLLLAHESESDVETGITDLLSAMRDCVGQLPHRSRDLLQRRYVDNENATTLARGMRMNADTVRQQLLRIRLAVKQCVERKVVGLWS
jgi:RNA polymerase sigma-70 factor (ECF subfamily)